MVSQAKRNIFESVAAADERRACRMFAVAQSQLQVRRRHQEQNQIHEGQRSQLCAGEITTLMS